ncbi:MAG: helix-turn-helix domain-containing protein [Patescibacteria group bacterium]|nr:helix-turn-helix domain-containing protein [Patescibacteria group bacterium]
MPKIDSSLQAALSDLGFSDKETKVYLALLEIGRGTVSAIARTASINRTTGYNILDVLVSKGLARISGKEPKEEYVAEAPNVITKLLKEKIAAYEAQLKKAAKLVPQLATIHNIVDRPKVKFYEGKEGLIEVYEDTLTSTEEIRAYATLDDMYQALPNYFPDYFKRRAKKKIPIKAIIPFTKVATERMKYNKEEMRTAALIPERQFRFSPEINIYDNKVMIASWREKLGIIIESAEIADAMKKIYELAWAEAKRLDRETRESPPIGLRKD